jgi:predicted transcriptional regulator
MVMQIELSDEQAQALKKIADRKGQTVPELIVSSVDAMLTTVRISSDARSR